MRQIPDFVADLQDRARQELVALGFTLSEVGALDDPLLVWLAYERRRISRVSRSVLESPRLSTNLKRPQYSAVIDDIVQRAESGDDLSPYLSRRMKSVDYEDALLNDWGIHHFHLGGVLESDGYVKRTGDLLYGLVRDNTLFLIDVLHHNSFEDTDLLEVVHSTWPALMEPWRARGTSATTTVTPELRKKLRRRGIIATFVANDGTLYFPPGGGYMSSGLSAQAILRRDAWTTLAHANQAAMAADWPGVVANIARVLEVHEDDVDLHLYRPARDVYNVVLIERRAQVLVHLERPASDAAPA